MTHELSNSLFPASSPSLSSSPEGSNSPRNIHTKIASISMATNTQDTQGNAKHFSSSAGTRWIAKLKGSTSSPLTFIRSLS